MSILIRHSGSMKETIERAPDGYRLPTRLELKDAVANNQVTGMGYGWTSTQGEDPGSYWIVNLRTGALALDYSYNTYVSVYTPGYVPYNEDEDMLSDPFLDSEDNEQDID